MARLISFQGYSTYSETAATSFHSKVGDELAVQDHDTGPEELFAFVDLFSLWKTRNVALPQRPGDESVSKVNISYFGCPRQTI
jgi:hypothetical protein